MFGFGRNTDPKKKPAQPIVAMDEFPAYEIMCTEEDNDLMQEVMARNRQLERETFKLKTELNFKQNEVEDKDKMVDYQKK
jgi:hypothetical protein